MRGRPTLVDQRRLAQQLLALLAPKRESHASVWVSRAEHFVVSEGFVASADRVERQVLADATDPRAEGAATLIAIQLVQSRDQRLLQSHSGESGVQPAPESPQAMGILVILKKHWRAM